MLAGTIGCRYSTFTHDLVWTAFDTLTAPGCWDINPDYMVRFLLAGTVGASSGGYLNLRRVVQVGRVLGWW